MDGLYNFLQDFLFWYVLMKCVHCNTLLGHHILFLNHAEGSLDWFRQPQSFLLSLESGGIFFSDRIDNPDLF